LNCPEECVLNDWEGHEDVEAPHVVLSNAEVAADLVADSDLDKEVNGEGVDHEERSCYEGKGVPDGVSVPADETLSEESHQEGGRLNRDQGVEANIHEAGVLWNKSSSSSADLEHGVGFGDGSWDDLVHTMLATNGGLIGISWSIAVSDFIDNEAVCKDYREDSEVVNFIMLHGPEVCE